MFDLHDKNTLKRQTYLDLEESRLIYSEDNKLGNLPEKKIHWLQ